MQYFAGIALIFVSVLSTGLSIPPLLMGRTFEAKHIVPLASSVNYRLPNNTLPEAYTVELTTNVHTGERDFTGIMQIDLKVVETTSTITIHARQLTGFVASIIRTDQTPATSNVLTTSYLASTEFLQLSAVGLQFPKGSKWRLTINYQGILRTDNGGFYLSSYEDEQKQKRYLATTQFESTDARHAFPCYDEPAKRADFTIKINHDPSYTAISNMPVDTEKSTSGHTVFQTLKSSPTYLVAFIVSDFTPSTGELDSLPQRVFSRTGTENSREFALLSGMLTMNRLNTYYGINFPLPKLDIVAIPDFAAGAMENWGLTTYREEYSLYNDKTSSVTTQNNVASTIAHENTHQWFGDLVALKWWSYLWMKEGFATLFEIEATNEAFPEWDFMQNYHTTVFMVALNADGSVNSRPLTYYVDQPSQISKLYDSISYQKGGAVLHMWQNALTDTVFRRGLHNYLEINQNSAADEDDLFEAIQIAAGEENFPVVATVQEMMSSWTRQSNYPLLTVTRDYETGTFEVTQEAFFDDETHKDNKTWFVPFNYVTESKPDFRDTIATHYMKKEKIFFVNDVNISPEHWLILNKQSTGLYRINYDNQNWNLITDQLLNKYYKIHVRNRAQLIYDAYTLGTSKRLEHSIMLRLLTYLPEEDQYAPWFAAQTVITQFDRYLKGDDKYQNFQKFVAQLVEKPYDKLGSNDVIGQSHLQPLMRNIIINLASIAGIETCLKDISNKLVDSIRNNIPIEPNLRQVTYCNGLKKADDKTFDAVYDLLMESEDQALRRTLIRALGCSESPTQVQKFIESSIDMSNKLRTQERITLLAPTYSSSAVGLEKSIEFLQANWDAYAALTADFSGSNPAEEDLQGLSLYVDNDPEADKVKALLNVVRSKLSPNVESTILANIDTNFNWLINNRNAIMKWVNANIDPSSSGSIKSSSLSFKLLLAFLCITLLKHII